MITLFAYVDGYDLAELEADLLQHFNEFVRGWGVSTARVINSRPAPSAHLSEDDLPVWNLGLNFTVDRLPREKIKELVKFLSTLARRTGRTFNIGGPAGEDWFSIGPEPKENVVELLAEQLA